MNMRVSATHLLLLECSSFKYLSLLVYGITRKREILDKSLYDEYTHDSCVRDP